MSHRSPRLNDRRRQAAHLTPAELLDLKARLASVSSLNAMRDMPVEKQAGARKYGNTKVKDGDITFDSKAEHKRWCYLQVLLRAREISELQRQVPFELIPAMDIPSGGKQRPTVYLADFVYLDKAGRQVVEDVKGAVTPEFRLKRKLMLWRWGIEIQEVRS